MAAKATHFIDGAEAAQKGEEVIVIYITSLLDAGERLPEPVALAAIA